MWLGPGGPTGARTAQARSEGTLPGSALAQLQAWTEAPRPSPRPLCHEGERTGLDRPRRGKQAGRSPGLFGSPRAGRTLARRWPDPGAGVLCCCANSSPLASADSRRGLRGRGAGAGARAGAGGGADTQGCCSKCAHSCSVQEVLPYALFLTLVKGLGGEKANGIKIPPCTHRPPQGLSAHSLHTHQAPSRAEAGTWGVGGRPGVPGSPAGTCEPAELRPGPAHGQRHILCLAPSFGNFTGDSNTHRRPYAESSRLPLLPSPRAPASPQAKPGRPIQPQRVLLTPQHRAPSCPRPLRRGAPGWAPAWRQEEGGFSRQQPSQ